MVPEATAPGDGRSEQGQVRTEPLSAAETALALPPSRHPGESRQPDFFSWIPTFVGMTECANQDELKGNAVVPEIA
jgi:hypothetical protein